MYQKISTADNVRSYSVYNDRLLIVDRQSNLLLGQESVAANVDSVIRMVYADRYLVYLIQNGATEVIDLHNRHKISADIVPLLNTLGNGTLVAYRNAKLGRDYFVTADFGLYEFPSMELRMEFSMKQIDKCYRVGQQLLLEERGVVYSLDLSSGQIQWRTEVGIIKQFLTVHQGILWMEGQLTQSFSTIRAFDVATGKAVDYLKHIDLPAEPIVQVAPDGLSLFVVGRGVPFESAAYVELDLVTRTVKRQGGLDSARIGALSRAIQEYAMAGGYIYCTARIDGASMAKGLCILDYNNLSTVWWAQIESMDGAFFGAGHMPQVIGSDFYILDARGFLHQYRRV